MTTDVNVTQTTTDAQAAANAAAQKSLEGTTAAHGGVNYTEQRAREKGWRPREEFNDDDKEFISADEFLRRGELLDKIKALNKKSQDQDRAIKMLAEHHKRVRENEFNRAIDYLNQERKNALVNGDVAKAVDLETQRDQVREKFDEFKRETAQAAQVHNGPPPEFHEFMNRNTWYTRNIEATKTADALGIAYRQSNPDADYSDVLNHVEKQIRKIYPDLAGRGDPAVAAVDSSSTASATNTRKGRDTVTLTDEEKHVMDTLIRRKVMTKEEYIADIKRLRG